MRALSLRFGSVTERLVDGGADGRNTTAAVAAMNEFAVDLYWAVVAEQGGLRPHPRRPNRWQPHRVERCEQGVDAARSGVA